MQKNSEQTNSFLIHISALAGYFIPLGSIIIPLILWKTLKNPSSFTEHHAKEAVNFNLSICIYELILAGFLLISVLGIVLFFGIFGVALFGLSIAILELSKLALIIIASLKAQNGEAYTYPFSINFIK
ncbi:DUF4870 domain-containing protein [Flavicella marina]|uniref:DUF4870 domain-containing protein n=1 Tax=Flavicella marina TaxID=1475951 RepID=UPI00126527DF|nr:DUF4870 domain-containing protein [Flavicella marina]